MILGSGGTMKEQSFQNLLVYTSATSVHTLGHFQGDQTHTYANANKNLQIQFQMFWYSQEVETEFTCFLFQGSEEKKTHPGGWVSVP